MDLLTVFERVAAHKRREISFLNHEAARTDNPLRLQEINGLLDERFQSLDELSKKINQFKKKENSWKKEKRICVVLGE